MGFFDELGKALGPHADRLNDTFKFHLIAIHQRLEKIEQATFDLGRGDIGNNWQRFQARRRFGTGENFELGTCPMNEIWLIQSISADGVQESSPAFVILANEILLESVIKEGLGFEGIGGSQVVFPGEILSITARAEGKINCVITVIRRPLPSNKVPTDYGIGTERNSPKQTHDVARDEIAQRIPALYGPREPSAQDTLARTEQVIGMTRRQ